MKEIPLRNQYGKVSAYTQVDDDNYDWLNQWVWRLGDGYAVRHAAKMHRLVLGLATGDPRQGDHRNRNKLDNQRANLRIVTDAEQKQNRDPYRNSRSGIRGVNFHTRSGRWTVRVQVANESHFIGLFDTLVDAEVAAKNARARLMPFAVD